MQLLLIPLNEDHKWVYSTHIGFFLGMKPTLDLEYLTLKALIFSLNLANVPEDKIYPMIHYW
jgi:hypothetical protein